MKKEIEENTNKSKHIWCSWIGGINIIKMSIILKAIYRFIEISIKAPIAYFTDLQQIFQKCIWNPAIWGKKNEVGGITIPDIKLYYRSMVVKIAWYRRRNRHR